MSRVLLLPDTTSWFRPGWTVHMYLEYVIGFQHELLLDWFLLCCGFLRSRYRDKHMRVCYGILLNMVPSVYNVYLFIYWDCPWQIRSLCHKISTSKDLKKQHLGFLYALVQEYFFLHYLLYLRIRLVMSHLLYQCTVITPVTLCHIKVPFKLSQNVTYTLVHLLIPEGSIISVYCVPAVSFCWSNTSSLYYGADVQVTSQKETWLPKRVIRNWPIRMTICLTACLKLWGSLVSVCNCVSHVL